MKISRYTGSDMRQALRAVRAHLGPDAVILSTRPCDAGVEVTAAVDLEAARLAAEAAAPVPAASANPLTPELAIPAIAPRSNVGATPIPGVEALGQELKTLRRMLETQVAQLAWHDMARRAPVHAELLRELDHMGFERALATAVVEALPTSGDLTALRTRVLVTLAQRLALAPERWLEQGGHIALLGPTGAGKTTTLAKLAVRWVLRHGARDVTIVAADGVRLGAQQQLQGFGRLLGIDVQPLDELDSLGRLLEGLRPRRLVLVDLPGMNPRDPSPWQRLAALSSEGGRLETTLVLPASADAATLAQTLNVSGVLQPTQCVITKLDEAASLGSLLSVLITSRLPLMYVCDGQRVPEDLHPARADELLERAVALANAALGATPDSHEQRRFGDLVHATA